MAPVLSAASLAVLVMLVLAVMTSRSLSSPTPTPQVFDPRAAASPEVVERLLGAAPAGYTWDYMHDWDGSIRRVYLVTAPQRDGPIDRSVGERYRSMAPAEGYWWHTTYAFVPNQGDALIRLCLRRTQCPEGQETNRRVCMKLQ